MKNISFLKISRSILLASIIMGMGVIGHAQSGAGTGTSKSGGTLTGPGSDSPQGGPGSTSGRTLTGPGSDSPQGGPGSASGRTLTGPGSDSPQGGPASGQGMTGKKASPTSSSKKQ
jgi:hypothetical protein